MLKVIMKSGFKGSKRKIEIELLKNINERRSLQLAQAKQGGNHVEVIEEKPPKKFSSRVSPEKVYANPYIWRR